MDLISASMIQSLNTERKRQFEELLPLIIKKLIIAGNVDLTKIRIPSGNDIWAPGFDGIICCESGNTYVAEGTSVWEFGTSSDSLNKINSDYDKRTKDSLGIEKEQTTFYLVVPKIWAYSSQISEWEADHNDWKAVHVYDASVLCDWINSEPTVSSWLLSVLFDKTVDFCTIDQGWERFSHKTEPAFSSGMFLGKRDSELKIFEKSLHQQTVKVKADSIIDSTGFVLSALVKKRDLSEKCIVVSNATTFNAIQSMVRDKIIVLNYCCNHEIPSNNNCIVLCYNKEAVSVSPDIQLNAYTKMHYFEAFREMGISDSMAHELYAFCHGNLNALIRRIPGLSNETIPEWAKVENRGLLEPVVFLRSFNIRTDKTLVEKIAGCAFDAVDMFYNMLLQMDDSPIKRIEDNYLLINYEEAWNVLGCGSNITAFERLHNSVKWFLNELVEEGLYTGLYGQTHTIKQHIRNLFINYTYYSFSGGLSNSLSKATSELLEYVSEPRVSELICDNLSILAEADPNTIAEFLEKDLKNEHSLLLPLFCVEDYRCEYTGVLSALDELTLHRSTAVRACKILFLLYQKDYSYKIVNSPKESLLTALCLINSEVALTTSQKIDLLRFFSQNDVHRTAVLISDLLGKDSFWKSVRYGEHHNDAQNELTVQEVIEASEIITEMALSYSASTADATVLLAIIKKYRHLRPVFLSGILDKYPLNGFKSNEILPIIFQLRERIFAIQKYNFENERAYLSVFRKWADALEALCPKEEQDWWLFVKTYDCPAEELLECKDDYYEVQNRTRIIRRQRIELAFAEYGINGILRLIKVMENYPYWGDLLAGLLPKEHFQEIVNGLTCEEKYLFLSGLIDAESEDNAIDIFSAVPKDMRLDVLRCISRKGFWKHLSSDEEKKAFWNNQIMREYDSVVFAQLLKYNPSGLLIYYYERMQKDPLHHFEQAMLVVQALLAGCTSLAVQSKNDEHEISTIVACIDSCYYSEEWASITISLYEKKLVNELPVSGRKYYFYHPNKYVDYVKTGSSTYYSEVYKFKLPDDACEEYDTLLFFVDTLISADEKNLAANIIGRVPEGNDGIRICPTIRNLLEKVDDTEFDNSVIVGILNTNGVRTVMDGEDQKSLAQKFNDDAIELELFYPHASYVLRELSSFYSDEGRRDYIHSEIYDY